MSGWKLGVFLASNRQSSEMLLNTRESTAQPTQQRIIGSINSVAVERDSLSIDYSSQLIILELNILKSSLYESSEESGLYFTQKG